MKRTISAFLACLSLTVYSQTSPNQTLPDSGTSIQPALNPPPPSQQSNQQANPQGNALPDGLGPVPNEVGQTPSRPTLVNPYERKATDLIFFPNANELVLGAEAGSISEKYTVELDGGSDDLYQIDNETFYVGAGGLYAFNDRFAAGATVIRVLKENEQTDYGNDSIKAGQTEHENSKGFLDPEFNLIYHALDVSRDRYDLNIYLNLSPKLQDAENSDETHDGNVAKGRSTYELGVEWGRRNPGAYSWAVGLLLTSLGERSAKNPDGTKTKVSSFSTFDLTSDFQWVLSRAFSIELNLGLASTGEYKVKYSDGSHQKVEDSAEFKLGTTGNITIGDRVYLIFSLAGYASGDTDSKDSSGNEYTIRDITRGILSARLVKQF